MSLYLFIAGWAFLAFCGWALCAVASRADDLAEAGHDDLRAAFDKACDRFDLVNDWEGPMRCGISEEDHSAAVMPRRREVDRLWRLADKRGVDVSDIARRWDIGR